MNQYLKYILLIILGIILFIVINNKESFSIGNQLFIIHNEKIKIKTYPYDDEGKLIKCRSGSRCTLWTFLMIFNSISEIFPKRTISSVSEYLEEYEGMSNFIESKFLKDGLVELNLVHNDDSRINTIALFKETITIPTEEKELKTFYDGIEYMFEKILENGTALIVGLTFLDEGIAQAHSVIFYKESEESYLFIDPTSISKNFNVTNIREFYTRIHKHNPTYCYIKLDYKSATLKIKGENIINNTTTIEILPEDKYWDKLSDEERRAANILEVDSEQKWERYNENQDYQNWTGKSWDELNIKEKAAANILKFTKYDFILKPSTSSSSSSEEDDDDDEKETLNIGDECNELDWFGLQSHPDRCISASGTCESKSPDEDLCNLGQCFCYGTEGAPCIENNCENRQKYGINPRLFFHRLDPLREGVTSDSGHPHCADAFKCVDGRCTPDVWIID